MPDSHTKQKVKKAYLLICFSLRLCIVHMIGVGKMSCEEYIEEINKMLGIAFERRDKPVLAFVYKLLCKYMKAA